MTPTGLADESLSTEGAAELYQLIADTIPHMVWTARADGGIDYVNARVLEYTGLPKQSHYGWSWKGVVHPQDWDACRTTWTRSLQTGERYGMEYRLRRADGAWRWHHGSALPLRGADGGILRWFGTCTDIEDQIRSARQLGTMVEERARALDASERRFQEFMDHLPALAWIRDENFRYSYVNRAYAEYHGLRPRDLVGTESATGLGADVAARIRASDREVLDSGRTMHYIDDVPGGKWLKVKFLLTDSGGRRYAAGVAVDVSTQAAAEQTAQRLLERLIGAQEAERRRLADDLHDLIGQSLTALGIELGALRSTLSPHSRQAAMPRLEAMAGLLNDTIESIRGVMTELRPPELEEFGLVAALRGHAATFAERMGIKVSVNAAGDVPRMRPEVELALFRIAQEALTNAGKHSEGSSVEITVVEWNGGARLTVQDDGRGFVDPVGARGARRGGWGLPEMRERAEAHGGTMRIEFPARGTRLVAEIPGRHVD